MDRDRELCTKAVTRRDIIVIGGRSQNGNERRQVFKLSKSGGGWVIDDIGS